MHDTLSTGRLPRHVAIIMDGNGRWALRRGLPRHRGHGHAIGAVRAVIQASAELGLEALTLYAFSTENWQRPPLELASIMALLGRFAKLELERLHRNGIRFRLIGDPERLPRAVRGPLDRLCETTAANTGLTLNVALNYGGRAELVRAVRALVQEAGQGGLPLEAIDEACVAGRLYTASLPDPDLLIRTGGEQRISNFLLWQLAYTELYFTDVLWPDFSRGDFLRALAAYQQRERRWGRAEAGVAPLPTWPPGR